MSIYIPCAILLLLFLYVNLTITMNPWSSKVHFLGQTRQTKRRTDRTGRTENQHERANSAPKSRACADVIQLCHSTSLPVGAILNVIFKSPHPLGRSQRSGGLAVALLSPRHHSFRFKKRNRSPPKPIKIWKNWQRLH